MAIMTEKRIEIKRVEDVLNRLEEISNPAISLQQFVSANFERLQRSGKSLKALHDFLLTNGIEVGSYDHFRMIYNIEKGKRARKSTPNASIEPIQSKKILVHEKSVPTVVPKPVESTSSAQAKQYIEPEKSSEKVVAEENAKTNSQNADVEGQTKKRGQGLKPIYLPDGKTEVIIDPLTGGRRFKI